MCKNVLKDFPYQEYMTLLEGALNDGVHIVHVRVGRKGGATVAWRRAGDDSRNRMVEVAMSFCSPNDVFVRKIGTYNALYNFDNHHTVLLPIGSVDSSDIDKTVRFIATLSMHSTTAYLPK